MVGRKNGLASRIGRLVNYHPAAALWTGTIFVAVVTVMVSFTPVYADTGCPGDFYG